MIVKRRKNNLLAWFLEPFVRTRHNVGQPDMVLFIVVGILLFLGLIFLSSASSTQAFYQHHDTYRFVKQQLIHGIIPGLILFYMALRVDYNFYKKFTYLFLGASIILLFLVFISNFKSGFGTAQSWISFGSLVFQPSELVKLLFILFLAGWFDKRGQEMVNFKTTTIPFIIIFLVISFLLIKQPDVGTLSIIAITALSMYYAAGAHWKHLGLILAGGALSFVVLIKAASYRLARFSAWFNPEVDPQGIGWQIKQALIAVGSGGWFGQGLGASRQKSYLPMPANDSIFAVIAEEIGFIFTAALLCLFTVFMYKGFQIAKNAPDNFSKLLALGITMWISSQIFINIAGMIQLMPITGVPLPFISLGGTNLVMTLLSVGILANISRFSRN